MKFTLKDFTNITFNGFEFKIPEETLNIITNLSQQVGSPTYIKTPIFSKKEHFDQDNDSQDVFKRKKRMNKPPEILNDSEWDSKRTFQATKIEHKEGLDAKIDIIRGALNKMSEKNNKGIVSQDKMAWIADVPFTEADLQKSKEKIIEAIKQVLS